MDSTTTDDRTFPVDLSDKLHVVSSEETQKKVHKFEGKDIYDIISYFLESKSSDDPFYIVDLGEIQRKYTLWNKCLPNVQMYYAIKSNPDPIILHVLAKLGSGFDCASKEEIILAKATGIDPSKIIYANPCKTIESLQFARSQDVDLLTFDSECELDKIKLYHPDAGCVIRIQVDDSGSECRFNSKFGCTLEEADELLSYAKINKINIVGVSFHVGSNCKYSGFFEKAISDARKVFDLALAKHGFKMTFLDIGGGMSSVPDAPIPLEVLSEEINSAIDKYFSDLPDVKIASEPGRAICTTSHTLVVPIIGIKRVYHKDEGIEEFKYSISDGIYGSFNCIMFDHAKPQILAFNERNEKTYKSTIFGPSCDSIDVITKDAQLPKLAVGDRIFVKNFGAYTRASSSSFNGFKTSTIHYIIT